MRQGDERGSVVILVLWGMAIVFVLLAAASFTTRSEIVIARNEVAAMRVRHAAEGGTQLGLAHLLARRAAGIAIFDATQETWQDGAVSVAIAIADEAGKIDINVAPPALIEGLFEAVGRTREDALLIACRVIEHRSGTSPCAPMLADDRMPARGALFTAPEELAALPGIGDRLYAAIADDVTVATGASAIDPEVAPRTVLLALPGATPALVDAYLAARQSWREMAPEMSGFGTLPGFPYLMVSPARDFTISATATAPDGARYRAALQVRLTGQAGQPYIVIAWRTPLPAPRR
jgi:general secretion pathway protein K